MDWVGLFTNINGRIGRKPFWIGMLILAVVELGLQLLADQFDSERIGAALDMIVAYPEFAVAVKRAHDRNIATWIIAAFFALTVMSDLMVFAGYGLNPTTEPVLFYVFVVPMGLFALVLLIDLGCRRGTQGDNPYGPDPLAAKL
jgi:uncharacterized membrane protein YhaH (DUF805 family)